MKTLANCTPKEFLVQTNKIRKSVANWLTLTGIKDIRKSLPEMPKGLSGEEKEKEIENHVYSNFNRILDSILENHPDETVELLGLLCFVEPEDVNNHPMTYYLGSVNDIIGSPEVIGFFTSLVKTGLIDIFNGLRV